MRQFCTSTLTLVLPSFYEQRKMHLHQHYLTDTSCAPHAKTCFRVTSIDGLSSASSSSSSFTASDNKTALPIHSHHATDDDDDDGLASLLTFWMLARESESERLKPRVLITFTKISGSSKTTQIHVHTAAAAFSLRFFYLFSKTFTFV